MKITIEKRNLIKHKLFNILETDINHINIKLEHNLTKCHIDFIRNDAFYYQCILYFNYKTITFYINIYKDKDTYLINFTYHKGDICIYLYNLYQLKYNLMKNELIEVLQPFYLPKELNGNDDIFILTRHILENIRSEYFDIYKDIMPLLCSFCEIKDFCYPLITQGILDILFSFIETNNSHIKRCVITSFRLLCYNTDQEIYKHVINHNIITYTEKIMVNTKLLQLSRECALLLNQLCIFYADIVSRTISSETIKWMKTHSDITLRNIGNLMI